MYSLNSEYERFQTFRNWPLHSISADSITAEGFYYLQFATRDRCAFSNIEVCCWVEGDDPMEDHQKWSPSCSFVKNQ